jgi:hypothetical protein
MKRFIFYNILIIIGFSFGCNKVELDPVDGNPVFTANAKFDGSPKSWQAGVDGYYMFSEFDKDEFDVYVFSGRFAKNDSTSGESLTFHIRDYRQVISGKPEIEESLKPGREFRFLNGNDADTIWVPVIETKYRATFDRSNSIVPLGLVPNIEWDFGDTNTSNDANLIVEHVYDTIGIDMAASLHIDVPFLGCSSFLSQKIKDPNDPSSHPCRLSNLILEDSLLNDSVRVRVEMDGVAPFAFLWNDGSTQDFVKFSDSLGYFSAAVTITDSEGCQVMASVDSLFVAPGVTPTLCAALFDHEVVSFNDTIGYTPIPIPSDSFYFSKIIIEFTSDGFNYRSDKFAQGPDAFFKIIAVSDYDLNEKGNKTKQLTIEYTCRLWNELGEFIDVTDGKAVIAVAYP